MGERIKGANVDVGQTVGCRNTVVSGGTKRRKAQYARSGKGKVKKARKRRAMPVETAEDVYYAMGSFRRRANEAVMGSPVDNGR